MNIEKRTSFLAGFIGRHSNIVDYLMETLFSKMHADDYKFLLETSILNVLEPGYCNAVTGRADSLAGKDSGYNKKEIPPYFRSKCWMYPAE